MPALPKIPVAWRDPLHVAIIAVVSLILFGGAAAAYVVLKRDSDQSCPPPCTLETEQEKPPSHREQVKTVDWPLYGYDDQRTRYLPTKRVRPPYDASVWSFQAGKLLEFAPIVARGTLYFQDKDAELYALSADKGKVEWRKRIGALGAASPAFSHGILYAVTLQRAPGVDEGEALALRARDGKLLWRYPLPGRSETSPIVVGSNVIVGSESGDVFALDRKSGKVDWRVHTDGAVKGGLAYDDGVLYGANYAGQVFALKASNGSSVWQSSTQGLSFGRGGPVYSTPAVAYGRVFLGWIDTRVYRFDQDTGELLWSHSTGDWVYARPGRRRHAEDRADRLRRLQGPELLRARREDRRRALAEATSAASSSAPPPCSARPSTSPSSARTSARSASTSRPARRSSSRTSASTTR